MLPTMALRADKVGPSADRRGALAAETTRRAAGPVGRSRPIDPSTWNRTAGTTLRWRRRFCVLRWPRRVHFFSLDAFLGSYHVRLACLGNVDQHCSAAGLVEPSRLADKVQLFEVVRCSPGGALLGRRFFDRPHHRHRSVQTEYSHRPAPDLGVVGTPEQVVRGQAISDGFCSGCHSTTSPVTGGFYVGSEDLPVPIGSFVSSNLTPAGQLSRWSDVEIFRAIRNGVDRDGRRLIIMSYTNAGN